MAKSRSRRKTARPRRPQHSTSSKPQAQLDHAYELLEAQCWPEALEVLEKLKQQQPDKADILAALAITHYQLKDLSAYLLTCEHLNQVAPDNPDHVLPLGSAYEMNGRLALALLTYRRFLERWPEHEEASKVREVIARLEPAVQLLTAPADFPAGEELALAALHERSQILMEAGKYAEAIVVAKQLIERAPNFMPVRNNLSQMYSLAGRQAEALATAQEVLARLPENFQALSNLTRYLFLSGKLAEAQQTAARLRAIEAKVPDACVKKAEAFSYLGADEAVLEAAREAEAAGWLTEYDSFYLNHLAGVAAARLGQTEQARGFFKQALNLMPALEIAQENLDDLSQPPGLRNGPWAFALNRWIMQGAITDLIARTTQAARSKQEDESWRKTLQRYLQEHREVAGLLPILLERGGPDSRQFAITVIAFAGMPELLAALRDFALGQRGADRQRLEALNHCAQAGVIAGGEVRMWIEGQWTTMLSFGFELHEDYVQRYPKAVEQLLEKGIKASQKGDAVRAEQIFKQALELAPNAPEVLNNLAAAYALQGREQASEALIEEIAAKHPDYLFGCTNLAMVCARRGEFDRASELLKPLLSRKRLHVAEFASICAAEIELALARHQRKGAEAWFELWEQMLPNDPKLERFRDRVKPPARLTRDWRSLLWRK